MNRETDIQYRYLEAILDQQLCSRGFKKWRLGFSRDDGGRVESILPGIQRLRGEDRAWITVGVFVGFTQFARFMRDCPPYGIGDFKGRYPRLIGTDLGHLQPPYNLKEWPLIPSTNVEELGDTLLKEIEALAFPFLQRIPTLESVLVEWEQGFRFNSTDLSILLLTPAILWFLGRRAEAEEYMAARVQGTPASAFLWRQYREYLRQRTSAPAPRKKGKPKS